MKTPAKDNASKISSRNLILIWVLGMAPSAILFVLAAVISVLTLIPTAMAEKEKKKQALLSK